MKRVNVSLPTELTEKIEEEADQQGLDLSEKIRHDLLQVYFDGQ